MTTFPDLAPFDLWGLPSLAAVGWLDGCLEYTKGDVRMSDFAILVEACVNPWQYFASSGHHRCPKCRFTGGPARFVFSSFSVEIGSTHLLVPTSETVYVFPTLALHYIDAHEYRPPDQFLQALREMPPMRSIGYLRMLLRHGFRNVGAT